MHTKEELKRYQRKIYAASAVIIIALLTLLWVISKTFLTVTVLPADAKVYLDNKPVNISANGSGKAITKPGIHDLRVEAEGYINLNQELKLKRAGSSSISLKLNPAPKLMTGDTSGAEGLRASFISPADDFNTIFYLGNNDKTLFKTKFGFEDDNIKPEIINPISNNPLNDISNIVWSPKKDAAIFQKSDGYYFFDFKKYNFVDQKEVKYGADIGDLAWSPDDSKIAYYYAPGGGEQSLIFADKTNSEITRVANLKEMNISNPYLAWSPDSEWLIVIPRNVDLAQNKIYLFNAYSRQFKIINDTGGNLLAKFSGDGSKIIYSTYSKDPSSPVNSRVSVMDANGDNKRDLKIRAYLEKVIWLNNANDQIIVATYDSKTKSESVFEYNINSLSNQGLFYDLDVSMLISKICLSNDNNILFYTVDNKLYAVKII